MREFVLMSSVTNDERKASCRPLVDAENAFSRGTFVYRLCSLFAMAILGGSGGNPAAQGFISVFISSYMTFSRSKQLLPKLLSSWSRLILSCGH